MTLTTEGCSVDSVDREDGRVEMLEVQCRANLTMFANQGINSWTKLTQ